MSRSLTGSEQLPNKQQLTQQKMIAQVPKEGTRKENGIDTLTSPLAVHSICASRLLAASRSSAVINIKMA
jgi:hypothetical protein